MNTNKCVITCCKHCLTCVGGILLLKYKKYKKKLLKCYELTDKITSSLATFEVLISLSSNDDSVIDANKFHKLQTLYLQVIANVIIIVLLHITC